MLADPEPGREAADAIRSTIDRPDRADARRGGRPGAVLEGDLARILALCAAADGKDPRRASGVVLVLFR